MSSQKRKTSSLEHKLTAGLLSFEGALVSKLASENNKLLTAVEVYKISFVVAKELHKKEQLTRADYLVILEALYEAFKARKGSTLDANNTIWIERLKRALTLSTGNYLNERAQNNQLNLF